MWCVPKLDDEYRARMADLLDLYEKPLDPTEPVVCLDERPVQLLDSKREGREASPGRVARRDYEYTRCGTANVFCIVEPKAGRHMTHASRRRTAFEFAHALRRIARRYRRAKTIHLVVDNLSTHARSSLGRTFGWERGSTLWNRFTVHFTPTHGSWLNQAEIEVSLWSRECLGRRRIPTFDELDSETSAWTIDADVRRRKIHWMFTREKATKLFG
jgi:hypothetical protein